MTFRHNIAYMVSLFVSSLDINVIIHILYEIIKILHEKMLNAIYMYWFHSDTSAKNNSLNAHSDESWTSKFFLVTWAPIGTRHSTSFFWFLQKEKRRRNMDQLFFGMIIFLKILLKFIRYFTDGIYVKQSTSYWIKLW